MTTKRFSALLCVCLLLAVSGAGCPRSDTTDPNGGGKNVPVVSGTTEKPATADGAWHAVDDGIERMEYFSTALSAPVTLYRFSAERFTWKFANTTQPKMMDDWTATYPDAVFVMNGVYFHEDYSPSGFLSVSGTRVGKRQFDVDKSGLIDFSSGVRLVDTAQSAPDLSAIVDGAQAYPFLIKAGKGAVTKDTGKLARRSFIGTDTNGRVYLGVIATQPLSLYQAMNMLLELDIHWDNVLNLDGGPSTGFAAHTRDRNETVETYLPVPNVIVVERKP